MCVPEFEEKSWSGRKNNQRCEKDQELPDDYFLNLEEVWYVPLSESFFYWGHCSYQFTAQEDTDVACRKTYLKIQPQGHHLPTWGRSSLSTPYLCGWHGPHTSGSPGTRASAWHCSLFLGPAEGGGWLPGSASQQTQSPSFGQQHLPFSCNLLLIVPLSPMSELTSQLWAQTPQCLTSWGFIPACSHWAYSLNWKGWEISRFFRTNTRNLRKKTLGGSECLIGAGICDH